MESLLAPAQKIRLGGSNNFNYYVVYIFYFHSIEIKSGIFF